jgi:hypothetical protein
MLTDNEFINGTLPLPALLFYANYLLALTSAAQLPSPTADSASFVSLSEVFTEGSPSVPFPLTYCFTLAQTSSIRKAVSDETFLHVFVNICLLHILFSFWPILIKSRDSSVCIALGYGLNDRDSRVRFRAGAGNFSLYHCCVQKSLGLTHPPIQWVPRVLSLGVKRPGREADHSPPSSAEVKEWVELCLHSPIRLNGVVIS